jgi:hypothetical protein
MKNHFCRLEYGSGRGRSTTRPSTMRLHSSLAELDPPLGVRGSFYARIWAATPGCAGGDCAFAIVARDAGTNANRDRFAFRYNGDIYSLATTGHVDCRIQIAATSSAPKRIVTIRNGFIGSADLRVRVTQVSNSGRAKTLRGTFVVRETPSRIARARGCTSTFVDRYRVIGRAEK